MLELALTHPTRAAFAPFGEIITPSAVDPTTVNAGSARRYSDLAAIDVADGGGQVGVSIFVAQPRSATVTVEVLERHPLGSQLFMPLGLFAYAVVVAAGEPPFACGELTAFHITDGSGVNYRKGVWHMPLCALGKEGPFLVVDRIGPGENCDEYYLSDPERAVVRIGGATAGSCGEAGNSAFRSGFSTGG